MTFFDEGSALTEDSDFEEAEETQESGKEAAGEADSSKQTEGDTSQATEGKTSEDGSLKDQEKADKQELTEKGTKLDDDPMSRVNQELANERSKIRQYEQVLNDPNLLKSYVQQFDKPADKKTEDKAEETEMRYEDVQTTEDLQKFLKQQDRKVQEKIKELDTTISGVRSEQKSAVVATRIQSDIQAVREEYPELNPKNKDSYNPELDKAIGQLFEKYDYDTESRSFRGQASIKDIADIVMKAAGSSRKQGSEEAQTAVRDKRTGKAVSGASNAAPDESKMSPGQLIAYRIQQATRRR